MQILQCSEVGDNIEVEQVQDKGRNVYLSRLSSTDPTLDTFGSVVYDVNADAHFSSEDQPLMVMKKKKILEIKSSENWKQKIEDIFPSLVI